MKSSCSKERAEDTHKYAFSGGAESVDKQAGKPTTQCPSLPPSVNHADSASAILNRRNVESFLAYQPVQPHPFAFIAAVKRKLTVAAYDETSKRLYNSSRENAVERPYIDTNNSAAESKESLYQTVRKMNFIKPLKVPDVKISPKTVDCPSKESPITRDPASLKFTINSAAQKGEKTPKIMDRAHRKLDFSLSEGHSLISSEDIEPLTAPDLSISPSMAKKKDHTRDSSREKDSRSKRMKKDDTSATKIDETSQDTQKRAKNPRHVSRKDVADSRRAKSERAVPHPARDDSTSNKPKSKNFATSTVKKDEEKRVRSSSIHSAKTWRDRSLESRGRAASSESLAERTSKHEKIAVRDPPRGIDSEASALKYSDDLQILNALRQIEEQKLKTAHDNKPPKILPRSSQPSQQKPVEISGKDQHRRMLDRTKASINKSQPRTASSASEIPEEIETVSDSNSTKNVARSIYTEGSAQQSKNKPMDTSLSQSDANIDTQNATEGSSCEIFLDPTKISFRDDSYSQQEEFCDLVTPDINLTLRSKRRKPGSSENETEAELKTPKHKPTRATETPPNAGVPMLHPTALHMQFQAELHLFDSYNESLRQVMDVENCLYNAKHEKGKELLQKQRQANEEMKKKLMAMQAERDTVELAGGTWSLSDESAESKGSEKAANTEANRVVKPNDLHVEIHTDSRKSNSRQKIDVKDLRPDIKVAEVQTQTANDIATQTDTRVAARYTVQERLKQYPGITYERGVPENREIPEFSLGSLEQFEDLDHIEDISLPSKMRTMSEISLHETTSSIKTETGTEISISMRDVTCSFNKYLDLEMAQLIKDEKLMYDKIEMLFKSREKTLNDRTRKLVKLEEQKRALRDTGQDSRISSVKKKQRALLLKLQQEKDEMNRLKELHKMASQERKLMLQKQRNMFNPQMSTKNILTKLKRSADCQSPRRLSGPMKGYDIRSNSSMSSLVDSDKSQLDRSLIDLKLQQSDSSHRLEGKSLKSDLETSAPEKLENHRKYMSVLEETASSLNKLDEMNEFTSNYDALRQLESKARKFEEKMPSLKTNYPIRPKHSAPPLTHSQILELNQVSKTTAQNIDNAENFKSESDTLVEDLSKKSRPHSVESNAQQSAPLLKSTEVASEEIGQGENDSVYCRKSRASQVTEESLLVNYKGSKKPERAAPVDQDASKKTQQHPHESKSVTKRKGSKSAKGKPASNILTENILRSKGNANIVEDITKPSNKRTKTDKETILPEDHYQSSILEELDLNESQNSLHALVKHSRAVKDKNYKLLRDIASEHETKENILTRNMMERSMENRENNPRRDEPDLHNLGNISTRSQVSTFTISRHSSGDSEKSFSRSVVIRAQDHRFKTSKKLEQVLNAREAALTTRRNCVEDWIAWHTKLKAEENRVARMEQAAFKLVSTTANALPYNDTTVSSDTSDVEGRVELLAERLAERRAEMGKLKREARRQAKQRLKALEANLLNQIKKYDTTIHEMRKKLETQKTVIKDSDKLAIESRSVADFKVPEIPLKRIQEIYNSSDLLRSRSESDLIFSKVSQDDNNRKAYSSDNQDRSKDLVYKSSSSLDNKSSRLSKLPSASEEKTNQNAESVLEEAKKFAYSEKLSEVSSDRDSQTINSGSRSKESIASGDAGSLRITGTSAVDGVESIVEQTKTQSSEAGTVSGQILEVAQTPESEASSKLFSRKLECLQLTNKNLNDDISTLENDLRNLSEMMSHFSKRSDDKLKTDSAPLTEQDNTSSIAESIAKSTGKDITEELSQSETSSVPENLERVSIKSGHTYTEHSSVPPTHEDPISVGTAADCREEFETEATQVISPMIPEVDTLDANSPQITDFEARSKEILNVIERSIISEHVETPESGVNINNEVLEKSTKSMHDENEILSQELNSLEGDIKSISQIISNMAESKRNLGLATDLSVPAFTAEESSKLHEQTFDMTLQLENENTASAIIENEHRDELCSNEKSHESPIASPPGSIANIEDSSEKNSNAIGQLKESVAEEIAKDCIIAPEDSAGSSRLYEEEPESITEEISAGSQPEDDLYNEGSMISKKSSEVSERAENTDQERTNDSSLESSSHDNDDESKETEGGVSPDNDWTISDSFQVPEKTDEIAGIHWGDLTQPETEITIEPNDFSGISLHENSCDYAESLGGRIYEDNMSGEFADVSAFVPRGESTTVGYRFDETAEDVSKNYSVHVDELDDILDIIDRESKQTDESYRTRETAVTAEDAIAEPIGVSPATFDRIIPRPSDLNLTAEVEPVLQKLTEILQGVERNIARRRKSGTDADTNREIGEVPKSFEIKDSVASADPTSESVVTSEVFSAEVEKSEERETLSGRNRVLQDIANVEQLCEDVGVPTAASKREKTTPEDVENPTENASEETHERHSFGSNDDVIATKIVVPGTDDEWETVQQSVPELVGKTLEILRDPEYEDISEESLEVSEIFNAKESQRSSSLQKSSKIPEKYETTQRSEDVLRILDEISQQSHVASSNKHSQHLNDVRISVQVFGSVSPGLTSKKTNGENDGVELSSRTIEASEEDDAKSVEKDAAPLHETPSRELSPESKDHFCDGAILPLEEVLRKQETDVLSESSEGADTPRGVSEIEMDSPRGLDESRLDIDALDDDLLSGHDGAKSNGDASADFHVAPVIATSEKDIEAMIDKLKASLEQPGLEVAELEAKLLRIEQLQIELEIKKLEAEEVSFYVREIPNKPPPPYTPPGGGRLPSPQTSPSLPPAVVPSNVEELTAFTERATVLIFNAKNAGEDIMSLQPPLEICELSKDNNEIAKQDRRVYNTFLFDLCKETIAELYRSEYEKPGPSWTKPNVKTKPAMKIPKTVEQLNEYVSKEVATLFGFKTKLQRENMVMRWSRKRRDRVDELLAREAQAEEDEWTKFHHDELAVKNELTVAILDTLILETTNVVKAVYAKKRKVMA